MIEQGYPILYVGAHFSFGAASFVSVLLSLSCCFQHCLNRSIFYSLCVSGLDKTWRLPTVLYSRV